LIPDFHDETGTCKLVSDILGRIGDKWSILVIASLSAKTMRFSDLRRSIGNVSQKMLTQTLRNLERDGFVERVVTPTSPPRVDYSLTPLGAELTKPAVALADWAVEHGPQILEARREFDERASAATSHLPP